MNASIAMLVFFVIRLAIPLIALIVFGEWVSRRANLLNH